MEKYIYELKMKVRDYECDLKGIVNNANYQHYLEHTRHEFLTSVGISFARLHEEGVDPVVARMFKIMLIVGIVHNTLQVAFIIAYLHLQFHLFLFLSLSAK